VAPGAFLRCKTAWPIRASGVNASIESASFHDYMRSLLCVVALSKIQNLSTNKLGITFQRQGWLTPQSIEIPDLLSCPYNTWSGHQVKATPLMVVYQQYDAPIK
jgi:hypothetical protein